MATDPSAATNERDVARSKFDRLAAKYSVALSVEQFLAGQLREVTHIKVSRRGRMEGWSHDDVATRWNPARFQVATCPRGCGTLVWLVPEYGAKHAVVSIARRRNVLSTGLFGETEGLELDYHDDACPALAREKREARELNLKKLEEWLAARQAAIAADPNLLERELRQTRAGRRKLEALRRHEAEAARRAQDAARAAEAAYWREVEAKAERTRRWREANPGRARQLNREAQARWRERQRIAKAATAMTISDRPTRPRASSGSGRPMRDKTGYRDGRSTVDRADPARSGVASVGSSVPRRTGESVIEPTPHARLAHRGPNGLLNGAESHGGLVHSCL